MHFLSVAGSVARGSYELAAEAAPEPGFQINLFWILAQALSFLLFFAILYLVAFRRIGATLEDRRSKIEQGLKDAEQARKDREQAEAERAATLAEARREANDILTRAQKVADGSRERDIAATREELERIRAHASADLESEKQRAIADLRNEVADLALRAAGRVVGETMTDDRQRRLVQEFLADETATAGTTTPATGAIGTTGNAPDKDA
ncbi:MAG: F-type H+-transporting ATPase subunit b [Chloroflexota bacterium]|nr:F-type H+-transporting ATPase subunit b [Chloroflexota bacterium]